MPTQESTLPACTDGASVGLGGEPPTGISDDRVVGFDAMTGVVHGSAQHRRNLLRILNRENQERQSFVSMQTPTTCPPKPTKGIEVTVKGDESDLNSRPRSGHLQATDTWNQTLMGGLANFTIKRPNIVPPQTTQASLTIVAQKQLERKERRRQMRRQTAFYQPGTDRALKTYLLSKQENMGSQTPNVVQGLLNVLQFTILI